MKVLVISFNDSDNLTIENVLYELEARGHQITIFASVREENAIRMFQGLNAEIKPIKSLSPAVARGFDIAFCTNMMMRYAFNLDIYCFVYTSYYNETFMTDGADFLFTYRSGCMPRCSYHCATMQVGDPKNDHVIYDPVHNSKRILYIDSGHMPFGHQGKEEIAEMILNICTHFPEYELCIKPRWLRSDASYTHRNTEHLYDIIEEKCGGDLPHNLTMLDKHLDLKELIDSSICVITLYTGAVLNVILQDKGLLVASGWSNEDKWDARNKVEIAEKDKLYRESGCVVDYREIIQYLPNGLHAKSEFIQKMFCYKTGASKRIVDVMEYVYKNFLMKGTFPAAEEYTYETYKQKMRADPDITISTLKQERIRDMLQQQVALLSYKITAPIDFSTYYTVLDQTYQQYPLTPEGYKSCQEFFNNLQNQIIVEQGKLLQNDPINQSFWLKALYGCNMEDEILAIPHVKILCNGPYYYYLGLIYEKRMRRALSIGYFLMFLKEANSRSYAKYIQEGDQGVRYAYQYIFHFYDGQNIDARSFADLYISYYESRSVSLTSYKARQRAHNRLPSVANSLAVQDPISAFKCLQLYAKWEYHYNTREKNEQIKQLQSELTRAKRLLWGYYLVRRIGRKITGGYKCLRENGLKYTLRRIKEKCRGKYTALKTRFLKISPVKILDIYGQKVKTGYQIYERIIKKYGESARLFLSGASTGDPYIYSSFFDSYTEREYPHNIEVFATFGKSGLEVANLFGIKNVEAFSTDEFKYLWNLLLADQQNILHLESLHYHVVYRHTSILMYLEGLHGFNLFSMSQAFLGVSSKAEIARPHFDSDLAELEAVMQGNKLIRGHTILLVPNAKSVARIPLSFWIELATELKSCGFTVCTNSIGDTEPAIPGTCPIFVPYSKLVPFLERCGAVVGLRSGFFDIASTAKCPKITLYPRKSHHRSIVCADYVSFSMKEMYHAENQYDILYSNEEAEDIIQQIVHQLKASLA